MVQIDDHGPTSLYKIRGSCWELNKEDFIHINI